MDALALLRTGLRRLDIHLSGECLERLDWYCRELERWNRRMNLVARKTTRQDLVEKHFLDSLTLVPLLRQYGRSGAALIDVGSGAGFPGLVLAVAMPELRVILLEPRQKRVTFLRHVARGLDLDVDIRSSRLEETRDLPEATFVTGRAVAAPDRFLQMVRPLLSASTMVLLMGGGRDEKTLPGTVAAAGMEIVADRDFRLPFSGSRRRIVLLTSGQSGYSGNFVANLV